MADFTMPSLGADMEAGTLAQWRVRPGDAVARGQIVAEVETDKGIIEVEIWQDGVVTELLVSEGARVPVGTPLARLAHEGDAATGPSAAPVAAAPPEPEQSPEPSEVSGGPPAARPSPAAPAPPRASPAARRKALEARVDLAAVRGSGPAGAITLADVEAAAAAPAPPKAGPPEPGSRAAMRRAIAAAMSRSARDIPQYHLATEVDMGAALAWLQEANAARPVQQRLLPAVLLVRAVARACRAMPQLNGHFIDGAFVPGSGVHVGFAVALRGSGLVAPALRDADRRDLDDLMAGLADLIERCKRGGLRSSELSDPTITITSLGDRGVEVVHGLITPPQVALVGFGRIATRPAVRDGGVVARPTLTATLAGDHRVTDGHEGAAFLAAVRADLEAPS